MALVSYYGTGRRKTSVARVRLVPGDGKVIINGRDMKEYFGLGTLELIVRQPLVLTEINMMFSRMWQAEAHPAKQVQFGTEFPGRSWSLTLSCAQLLRKPVF